MSKVKNSERSCGKAWKKDPKKKMLKRIKGFKYSENYIVLTDSKGRVIVYHKDVVK